ncbi:MAG: caspase family protein [Bacteroidales bacterium]|jgi:hypothetical protein|nr:caspase family protein [Bacteroidales bacterium]
MINKKALILGYPGIPGDEEYCEGVYHDINNYFEHFTSINGGAWNADCPESSEDEIFKELSITKKSLFEYINYFNKCAKYSVFIFAGHGYYTRQYGTIIQINNTESIPVSEIKFNAPRKLFIIDCCRKISSTRLIESNLRKSISIECFSDNREVYRARFDRLLNNSVEGTIEVYSCGINEYSQDISDRGGLFSSKLLDSAIGNENLTIFKTFETAKSFVQKMSRNEQNPIIVKPRMSGVSFPFYIA